ncbi:MAG: Aspartate ammonia-lyase [Ignavibacteriaceae bacterium]|nr:Aspartate ammonia-lyase [Ignavibacteriaceae bacterium]
MIMQNYSVLKYKDQLAGQQTRLAVSNFISSGEKIHPEMLKNYLLQKEASLRVNHRLGYLTGQEDSAITLALKELLYLFKSPDEHHRQIIYEIFPVDPLQGGAGTSLNQNMNEVIANLANFIIFESTETLGHIHPLDHVNMHQSTNDTFPSVFRASALVLFRQMQESFAGLQKALQAKEAEFAGARKPGRTQLQDAAPVTLGMEFGAYAQAIGRDRWRFYNAEERLKSINLGGTMVGTGAGAPLKYRQLICIEFAALTGLPLAKAEDTFEATQNLDGIIEAHGIIKTAACNLKKIANDLRLLSSGPEGGLAEIHLPERQAGSTIMPGKVNPVIPEHVVQIAESIKAHDQMISNLASEGNLELNQYYPAIAHYFLKSQEWLARTADLFAINCINDIRADAARCRDMLDRTCAEAVCFIREFGYDRVSIIVKQSRSSHKTFKEIFLKETGISEAEYEKYISARG